MIATTCPECHVRAGHNIYCSQLVQVRDALEQQPQTIYELGLADHDNLLSMSLDELMRLA